MSDSHPRPRYDRSGPVRVQPEALPRLARADTLIFDIDGVIMDVTRSIRVVGCEAVRVYLTQLLGWPDTGALVEPDEVELYQLADGFNDDWELTGINVLTYLVKAELAYSNEAAALRSAAPSIADLAAQARRSRGGVPHVREKLLGLLDAPGRDRVLARWDYQKIVQVFQELYAGEDHCYQFYGRHPQYVHAPGRIALDRPLIRRECLPRSATKLGIYSGRTWEESKAALEMADIYDLFTRERVIAVDDEMVKPDPRGLETLVERMDSAAAVFIGDMPDDRETVRRYRAAGSGRAEVFDCLALSGPMGGRPDEEISAAGADVIAPDVNVFMQWWAGVAAQTAPRAGDG